MALPAEVAALNNTRDITATSTTKGAGIIYVCEQVYDAGVPSYDIADYYDTVTKQFVLPSDSYSCLGNTDENPFQFGYNVDKELKYSGFSEVVTSIKTKSATLSGINFIEMKTSKLSKALEVMAEENFPYIMIRYENSNESDPSDLYFMYKGDMGGYTSNIGGKVLLMAEDITITGRKVPGKSEPYERIDLT